MSVSDDVGKWARVIASNASQIGPLEGGAEKRRLAILDRARLIDEAVSGLGRPSPAQPPSSGDDEGVLVLQATIRRNPDAERGFTLEQVRFTNDVSVEE